MRLLAEALHEALLEPYSHLVPLVCGHAPRDEDVDLDGIALAEATRMELVDPLHLLGSLDDAADLLLDLGAKADLSELLARWQ